MKKRSIFLCALFPVYSLCLFGTHTASSSTLSCDNFAVVSSPNANRGNNQFIDASIITANDVWATGYYYDGPAVKVLIAHKNSVQWNVVYTQPPNDNVIGALYGVAAIASNDVWAVGFGGPNAPAALAMHWNGTAWSLAPLPNPPANYEDSLGAIKAFSSNNAWAVGDRARIDCSGCEGSTLVMHWDGAQWSEVPSPNVGGAPINWLNGIAAVSPTNIWAVGNYRNCDMCPSQTLTERWNGTQWTLVPSPNIGTGHNFLNRAAAGIGFDSNVWAVGYYFSGTLTKALVLHWTGTQWVVALADGPGSGNSALGGVVALGSNNVWVSGISDSVLGSRKSLIEHWNGTNWGVVPSGNAGLGSNELNVLVYAPDYFAAIGGYDSTENQYIYHTLVETYQPTCGE